jgi:hypothetical protein
LGAWQGQCSRLEAPDQQRNHSWAVYHIRGTPSQFIGLVYDAPDEQKAIAE